MMTFKTSLCFIILTLLSTLSLHVPSTNAADSDSDLSDPRDIQLHDLFHVKPGTTHGGLENHVNIVQSWLTDTITLVDFILPRLPADPNAVDGNNLALVDNLEGWFGLRTGHTGGIVPDDHNGYLELRRKFMNLDAFLKEQTKKWTDVKPWIFFNSDWQERTELYFDDDGIPIDELGHALRDPSDPDFRPQANLRFTDPSNFPKLDQDGRDLFENMQRGSPPDNWENYAFWSSDIRDYTVLTKAEARKFGPNGVCDAPGFDMFALTNPKLLADTITLCPLAFTNQAELWETIHDGLNSPAATNNRLGVQLQATSPRSLTLFHELIHMTSGVENTEDKGTKPVRCLSLITKGHFDEARSNPDSIVFFAWSYYLEKRGNPSFTWHTGVKRQR